MRTYLLSILFAAGAAAVAPPAEAQQRAPQRSPAPATTAEQRAAEELAAAVHADMGSGTFFERQHIDLTPVRTPAPGDSARAWAVLSDLRRALEPYRNVERARRDGFQIFAPNIPGQTVFHFVHYAWGMANETSWNPAKPSALLYQRGNGEQWILVGAMYTAPMGASLASLDQRVPLSIARWHRHVNFCVPPRGERNRWSERKRGRPVFGPQGVATREECDEVGGRFLPQVFGWMLHVSPFTNDLAQAFGHDEHGHDH